MNGWNAKGSIKYQQFGGDPATIDEQGFLIASEDFHVIGPVDQVEKIVSGLGREVINHGIGGYGWPEGKMRYWDWPCEDQPFPDIGIIFDVDGKDSTEQPSWSIDSSVWTRKGGGCSAPIIGYADMPANTWHLGQTWLRGKYVDFDLTNKAITVGNQTGSNDEATQAPGEDNMIRMPLRKQSTH